VNSMNSEIASRRCKCICRRGGANTDASSSELAVAQVTPDIMQLVVCMYAYDDVVRIWAVIESAEVLTRAVR